MYRMVPQVPEAVTVGMADFRALPKTSLDCWTNNEKKGIGAAVLTITGKIAKFLP